MEVGFFLRFCIGIQPFSDFYFKAGNICFSFDTDLMFYKQRKNENKFEISCQRDPDYPDNYFPLYFERTETEWYNKKIP